MKEGGREGGREGGTTVGAWRGPLLCWLGSGMDLGIGGRGELYIYPEWMWHIKSSGLIDHGQWQGSRLTQQASTCPVSTGLAYDRPGRGSGQGRGRQSTTRCDA